MWLKRCSPAHNRNPVQVALKGIEEVFETHSAEVKTWMGFLEHAVCPFFGAMNAKQAQEVTQELLLASPAEKDLDDNVWESLQTVVEVSVRVKGCLNLFPTTHPHHMASSRWECYPEEPKPTSDPTLALALASPNLKAGNAVAKKSNAKKKKRLEDNSDGDSDEERRVRVRATRGQLRRGGGAATWNTASRTYM